MKLLASDYDGTLHYGGAIMEEDLDAIRKWKEDGNLFVLATGRSLQSIKEQIKKFDIPYDYLITNNGGMVFDGSDNEMMANYLDYITAIDIIYAAKELENVASYVVNDGKLRHKIVVDPTVTDRRYPTLQPDMSEEELLDSGRNSRSWYFLCLVAKKRWQWRNRSIIFSDRPLRHTRTTALSISFRKVFRKVRDSTLSWRLRK